MKLILFALCIILNLSVYAKERVIAICEVVKTTYVHISPYNSNYKQEEKTNYTAYSNRTDETYSLSTEGQNFNILYKSKKNSLFNWNLSQQMKNFNAIVSVLNTSINNLVIKTTYSNSNEQIYYFNLDKNYNGYLTLLNIRWNSFMDSANNASLYFCECKGAIK